MDYFFLGDEELVTAFRFIGIDGFAAKDPEQAIAVFRKITEDSYTGAGEPPSPSLFGGESLPENIPGAEECQVLILTEETADWLGDYMINWQLHGNYPLLVEIPGITGRLEGRKTLVDAIREAIGIRV
ncbi:MAG: V-type ATP synthase subunit F [Treponema sp.]|nr:V-type ATP synthase subunit F [Treponema sp.]MCL2267031.1 V-type ATP synthase subunit F [Treponema sp.]